MLDITPLNIGWFILFIIQVIIGVSFFRKYSLDKDKRKLIFGLAFFIIGYSHLYEAFSSFIASSPYYTFLENIQYWSFYPLVFAIGIATHQRFFKNIDYDKVFRFYLFLSFVLLPIFVFNPIPANEYAGYIAICIGTEVVFLSLINTYKNRDAFTILLFLANICYITGGVGLQLGVYSNAIFAFFLGDLLILFLFLIPDNVSTETSSKISNFFTLEKQLTKTKIELKNATDKYHRLTETLPEGIIAIDSYGKVSYANPAMEQIFNISFSKSKGKIFSKYLTKESKVKSIQLLKKIKKGGTIEKIELEAIHQDTHIFPIEVWATPILKNEKYDGIICIIRDITERKQTEEEMIKLVEVVKHTQELVNLSTIDGRMIFLNEAGYKMLGIDPSQIQNYSIIQVINEPFIPLVQNELLPTLTSTGSWNGDLQYKNQKTGEITDVHATTFMVNEPHTNKPLYLANVSLDITERKKSEKELYQAHQLLKKMNVDLEEKVKDRTKEIKHLLTQKDEFINQLGHDLKNPLGPLLNLLPVIDKYEKDPKKKEMIGVMLRNTNYMKNLVIKTLELARLNSPNTKLNLEYFKLKELIELVLMNNKFLFEQKQITVNNNVSNDITINADRLKIEELVTNLLNNCVKYSDKNGTISINSETVKSFVQISIIDTGIGMSTEQLDRIFDEFYKADTSRHDFDSSGLGMPIAKRIVEKHGGNIWAESDGKGKGSTFYFTLPITQSDKVNDCKQTSDEILIHNKIDALIH